MRSPASNTHDSFWAEVMITASAAQEPFEEVSVITLRSHFMDLVYERAISIVTNAGMDWNEVTIKRIAHEVMQNDPPVVAEQVVFNTNGTVVVVIDVPAVDDSTVFAVMGMIARAADTPRVGDTVILGMPVTYDTLLDS